MPKVLIREYDNSTTGFPTSNNFAVVVPGYLGEAGNDYLAAARTAEAAGLSVPEIPLLLENEVYEINSQSDFIKYIGKHAGIGMGAAGPTLEKELYNGPDANEYSTYINKISLGDFESILRSDEEKVYTATVILATDSRYGTNTKLIKTIEYYEMTPTDEQETDAGGNPAVDAGGNPIYKYEKAVTPTTVTVEFTPVTSTIDLTWDDNHFSNEDVCIIKNGAEGNSAIVTNHIGNQIAYELLGLGYTVLYKRLDPEVSAITQLNNPEFWAPLKDKSVFNFRYVMAGGCYESSVMNQICQLATFDNSIALEDAETYGRMAGRGDCIALCDINEQIAGHSVSSNNSLKVNLENIGYAAKEINKADQYSAIFGPRVTYAMAADAEFGNNKTFPASFHYLACAARTFGRYNEWYAVAGYNRGISSYAIETTSVKLGEIAINTLAPRTNNTYTTKSINLILNERGNYYLWGNRTGYALGTELLFHHFLNIRQLCCSIKKQLYTACRQFTFDPNSDLLWINFVNAIKPTLEAMKADQGIKGYTITKTATNKKALLTASIRIVPIEAVEDFDISIYLEDAITGIVVTANEAQA